MKFGSVDVLSELVWSPRNGLSLRCADFSFMGKSKSISPNFFDIGQQTNMSIHSISRSIEQQEEDVGSHQFNVESRNQDPVNQECNEMNRQLSGIGGSVEHMKLESVEMVEVKVENEEGSSDCAKGMDGETRDNEPLRLESTGFQEELTNREADKTGDRLESMDENNLAALAVVACEGKGENLPEDDTNVEKTGPSVSCSRREKGKGKEKALSDGNFEGDDADDGSFGSVESCNSAGLLSRGEKRSRGFEQRLILGSKRLKNLSQECFGSTSKFNQDSSFMNWISNMTKGIWKSNEEDNTVCAALTTTSEANGHGHGHGQVNAVVDQQQLNPCYLKETSERRDTGFQSFFQSIYCPKKRSQDVVEMDENHGNSNATSLQELPWIPEQCEITKGHQLSSSGNEIGPIAEPNIGFIQTSKTFSTENKHEYKEPNVSLLSLSTAKPNEESKARSGADEKVNRNSGLESLWISRFSCKSPFPHNKANETAKEANDTASDAANTRDSQKMQADTNVVIPPISSLDGFDKQNTDLPVVSLMRIESSEAMASSFARRLEAMKHILPSGSLVEHTEEGQTNLTCFYCGKKGHCLRDCVEVTDTELRDLVQNISARNAREEASSLCIRCFQLNHWAATCPNAPPHTSGAEDRAMKHALASTSSTKLPVSSFTEIPKAVFDAVQILRLTRTNVLKWINTKKSVSGLEGFFLRLRLRKWEEGHGGTGYYVARIDGDTEGQRQKRQTENCSISVKVKGMTCLVESQFISNHDFLEEEVKEWWRSARKSGERSDGDGECLPSADELSRKIQLRKMLGF